MATYNENYRFSVPMIFIENFDLSRILVADRYVRHQPTPFLFCFTKPLRELLRRCETQQVLMLSSQDKFASLVMHGGRHYRSRRILRFQSNNPERRVKRVARVHFFEKLA
jgi:hypothetical protein